MEILIGGLLVVGLTIVSIALWNAFKTSTGIDEIPELRRAVRELELHIRKEKSEREVYGSTADLSNRLRSVESTLRVLERTQ